MTCTPDPDRRRPRLRNALPLPRLVATVSAIITNPVSLSPVAALRSSLHLGGNADHLFFHFLRPRLSYRVNHSVSGVNFLFPSANPKLTPQCSPARISMTYAPSLPAHLCGVRKSILAGLLPKHPDSNAHAVVKKAASEATYLLSLKWGFILPTGGCEGYRVSSCEKYHPVPWSLLERHRLWSRTTLTST